MKIDVNELLQILRMSTARLFQELKKRPYAVCGKHYVLWHRGSGLPCLVAHIDHVYEEKGWNKRPILYNEEYIWSPRGIAGDDRAGVYACMQLFNELEVNVLFTDLEERGGVGAIEACECLQLEETLYFIEIDRRNEKEAVFYNEEEVLVPEFVEVVSRYFKIAQGSFSDISILGSHFKVASTNLSAGYFNEHSKTSEYIYLPALEYTINAVPKLISELGDKRYELPELPLWAYYSYRGIGKGKSIKSKSVKKESYLWWYDELKVDERQLCPIECRNCGSLELDRALGYYCWEIEGEPDPEHPKCIRQRMKELEPWL
jgi:hypothetical protein